jgi:hypothetical protein
MKGYIIVHWLINLIFTMMGNSNYSLSFNFDYLNGQ